MIILGISMEITITVNGISRNYRGDYDTMHANEWSDLVRDMIDSQVSEEKGYAKT
jgi:hypothetical protein